MVSVLDFYTCTGRARCLWKGSLFALMVLWWHSSRTAASVPFLSSATSAFHKLLCLHTLFCRLCPFAPSSTIAQLSASTTSESCPRNSWFPPFVSATSKLPELLKGSCNDGCRGYLLLVLRLPDLFRLLKAFFFFLFIFFSSPFFNLLEKLRFSFCSVQNFLQELSPAS